MTDRTTKQLVDAGVLAGILVVTVDTVNKMFRDGDLPAYRAGKRQLRFDVDECLKRLRVEAVVPDGCQEGAA